MDRALGINPEQSVHDNVEALGAFLDDENHTDGAERRKAVAIAQQILDCEFHTLGAEIGWFYPTADINGEAEKALHDGQITEQGALDQLHYHPSTIPGHRLPHAWRQKRGTRERKSTRDLVPLSKFLLITRTPHVWERFADETVEVLVVGKSENGWIDVEGTWTRVCRVIESGAVLVRPDNIAAWRAQDAEIAEEVAEATFETLLKLILKLDYQNTMKEAVERVSL